MKTLRIFKYVGFGILGLAGVILIIFITMWLWNSLVPVLFHGPVLTFWQTTGLFLLSKILLTGIAPGSNDHGRKDWRRKYDSKYYSRYYDKCKPINRDDEKLATPEQA